MSRERTEDNTKRRKYHNVRLLNPKQNSTTIQRILMHENGLHGFSLGHLTNPGTTSRQHTLFFFGSQNGKEVTIQVDYYMRAQKDKKL